MLVVAVSLLVALAAGSRFPGATADVLPDTPAGEGKRLAQRLCSTCHDIEPGGNTPRAGPALAELAQQPGYSVQWFRGWLANPHLGTPVPSLSESDIDILTAYYSTLAARGPGRIPGSGSFDYGGSDEGPEDLTSPDIGTDTSVQGDLDVGSSDFDQSVGDDFGDFDLGVPSEEGEVAPEKSPHWPPSGRQGR